MVYYYITEDIKISEQAYIKYFNIQ